MKKFFSKYLKLDITYLLQGGFWLTLGQLASIGGAFAISILFANTLSEHDFGTYRYLIGMGSILAICSLSGMQMSTLQATAKGLKSYVLIGTKTQLRYDSIAYVIGAGISVYYYINGNDQLALGICIVTLFVPLHATLHNIFSYFEGQKKFKKANALHTVKTLLVTVATLGTIYFTKNILILLFVYLGLQTLSNIVIFAVYHPKRQLTEDTSLHEKYFNYAKHTSVRNIISTLAVRADSILIFQNLGAVELAIYSVANILPEQVKSQFKNLARLLVPKYVEYDKPNIIQKNILTRSIQLFFFSIFLTIAYILIVPILYTTFLPDYPDAIILSQIIALAFPAMTAVIPMSALQAQHNESALHHINTIGSMLTLILSALLILSIGLLGAVLAKLISRYCLMFLAYFYLYKNKTTSFNN